MGYLELYNFKYVKPVIFNEYTRAKWPLMVDAVMGATNIRFVKVIDGPLPAYRKYTAVAH